VALDIQTLTLADLDAADTLLMAAYGGASRKRALRSYLELQPEGWVMARWDGAPAGVAGATIYGPTAYIGLVGVDPAYQRRGIALAMMRHLMAWCAERGNPMLLLDASDAGAPLYEQLGFATDERTTAYLRENSELQPSPSDLVSPLRPADLRAVAEFDAPIFGASRTTVLSLFLRDLPERAFVARDAAGQVSGYLFAQPAMLGPWAARTPADAEALLGAALQLTYDAGPQALTPSSNPHLDDLLRRYGFSPKRVLRHMRLGGAGPVGRRDLLYGLASFAIG
jgi:GNAT superfamily N-acetyltransferase